MSKIDQLLDRASDKFVAAEILTNQEYYEDAVSRLFYGLLFCARALLLTKSISSENPDEIISAFTKEFVTKNVVDKELGTLLKDTKTLAAKADFSLSFSISEEKVKKLLERAEQFMEKVEDATGDVE